MTAVNDQCPHCAYTIISADTTDAARDGQSPVVGNPAICIRCGEISEFDENLKLVKPSPERLVLHKADPEVQYAVRAWESLEPVRRARGWVT